MWALIRSCHFVHQHLEQKPDTILHPISPLLPPQVARCTKIINPNTDDAKYVINVKQIAKVKPQGRIPGWRLAVDNNKLCLECMRRFPHHSSCL